MLEIESSIFYHKSVEDGELFNFFFSAATNAEVIWEAKRNQRIQLTIDDIAIK